MMTATTAFELPVDLEAHQPPEARGLRRDGVRLLVSGSGRHQHAHFHDLASFLRRGDLLVVNDSATLPAALPATLEDGTQSTMHLSGPVPSAAFDLSSPLWVVEPRVRVPRAQTLRLAGGAEAELLFPYLAGPRRLWVARLRLPLPLLQYLARWGRPIAYSYVEGSWPLSAYQTIFGRRPGSVEMPSAARPFTPQLVRRLHQAGVRLAFITLHCGVSSQELHEPPFAEYFEVPAATAGAIRSTRRHGGRVVAVGTTVVRALESATTQHGVQAASGWTDLVVGPGRQLNSADALLSGLHEPRASHLQLLQAFCSFADLQSAYQNALSAGYLWHEFGDMHLILSDSFQPAALPFRYGNP